MALLLNPVTDPVLIFTIMMFIVLMVPVLLRKTRIPSIVGLMIVGIVIGPNGLSLISDSEIVKLFGEVGLLYILFLAGLEIEYSEFKKNSHKTVFFGLLTFIIPLALGYLAATQLFSLSAISGVLIGLLLASNTLIAFPIVSKMGLTKSPAVSIAIGGTIITDTLVLFTLAVISLLLTTAGETVFPYRLFATFTLYILGILFIIPRLSSWFFKTITTDGDLQFLYTLTILFALSYTAELAGAEPIIGAFFAGMILNRLIPANSALMNRVSFVGNTLFIPVFLISVGMLVNLRVLFTSFRPELYAVVFVILALSSKWLAAWFTKLVFRQSVQEMNLIFGLTSARAAATLAVALIGLNYDIIDRDIFNAIIILIMTTSLFSSWLTERSGRRYGRAEIDHIPANIKDAGKRVLVPIANPDNAEKLIDLAILIKPMDAKETIYPLAIVKDDRESGKKIREYKPVLDKIAQHASASDNYVHSITRVDVNIPDAIVRASKELMISEIVMGWSERAPEYNRVFGNILGSVLRGSDSTVIVCHLPQAVNTTDRLVVTAPPYAEKEPGFWQMLLLISQITGQLSCSVTFCVTPETTIAIQEAITTIKNHPLASYKTYVEPENLAASDTGKGQALYVIVSARAQTVSYKAKYRRLKFQLPENLNSRNLLIIYPHQA